VSIRPGRARLQSLCGTARGIASKKGISEARNAHRKPCRAHGRPPLGRPRDAQSARPGLR
jgi:hypothetical protein